MDAHERRRRSAAARADFLERGGCGGVPDLVTASWRRSQIAGVDADAYAAPYHDDVDLDSRLVRCARPVIERLSVDLAEVPMVIALSDARARIVARRDCSTAVGRLLDRVDFLPGFGFAEDGVGTNGIGTVFETGQPVSVVGAEHFTETLTRFACTGAPVLDPLTGRVEGVLDVSSLAETWTPLIHALVRSAAVDIGRNLFLDHSRAQQALFEVYLKADARPRQAVMAVGDTVMVNQRAQRLFSPDEQFAIHQHARFLMTRQRATESIELESGRSVHLRATRILAGSEVAGIVLLLDEDTGRRTTIGLQPQDRALPSVTAPDPATSRIANGLRNPPASSAPGSCPAWVRACSEIGVAVARGENLLVMGEPGTGKFTLLAELFHRAHPAGRRVSVDAGQVTRDGRIALGRTGTPGQPALTVLRNVDQLTAAGAEVLGDLLDTSDRSAGLVAATLSGTGVAPDLPFAALLVHFDRAVTLPPVRYRTADLPELVARTLRDLAPGRRTRLSADAARVLTAYTWPGNVTQLRDALQTALVRRPVGEIGVDDLPGYCRTAGNRTLTSLEVTERDVIVRTLQECGGNRVQAASRLGMARSSLYRKLRAYAVTEV
jgi:transcriptional regulator of acetoin/glycerol metabolism